MARIGRLLFSVILVCLAAHPSWSSLARPDWSSEGNGPDRGWARGPVWYIMTHQEYAAYRRLGGEPERSRFIRKFWDLRDPLPETPDNELEHEFWRRVSLADGQFGQEIKPGWKTERGKVFIMLGPPENVETDQIMADRTGSYSWVYDLNRMPFPLRQVLQDALGIPPDRRIVKVHVREESEGMRAVGRGLPGQSSVLRPTESLPLAEMLVRRMKGHDAEPLRLLGELMRVPEAIEPPARVDVSTVFDHVPVRVRVDFRPAPGSAEGRRTAIAITMGVAPHDLERAGVTASDPSHGAMRGRLTAEDDPARFYAFTGRWAPSTQEAGTAAGEDIPYQAVVLAPAGRYVLDVTFQNTDERVMGALRDLVPVPDFGEGGMSVSSLVLAARLEHLDDPFTPDPNVTPFAFGPYRVIPRTSDVYSGAEPLTVFYRAYGAQRDERGLPNLDISYQFYVQDGPRWLPVGAPIDVGHSTEVEQAWTVPLEGWPAGSYRLEVTVVDRFGGAASVRGATFSVAPPAPPDALPVP